MASEPIAKLDPAGQPTPLSYNVPQPSSYFGKNYIELDFVPKGSATANYFLPDLCKQPPLPPAVASVQDMPESALAKKLSEEFSKGIGSSALLDHLQRSGGRFTISPTLITAARPGLLGVGGSAASHQLKISVSNGVTDQGSISISPEQMASLLKMGQKFKVYRSMFGTPKIAVVPVVPKIRPRILLVETHRISTYLGKYGAGRVLSTASLLPGEKSRISIRSYTKESSTRTEASSILDSFTKESADDFETALQSERSKKTSSAESFEYHAEAEAEGSWGWGSAKVSGGVKGSTNSSREEFAKSTSNAVTKHAQKASAKRDIQINTTSVSMVETGNEQEIIREIENINVGKTLTSVFRQMNQEFITIQHLVDIRLAFFNGDSEQTREYALSDMDQLLDDVVIQTKHAEVKEVIETEISSIMDYLGNNPIAVDEQGTVVNNRKFIEEVERKDKKGTAAGSYWRFAKDLFSVYPNPGGSSIKEIPGIILGVTKNTMRTDGVMVETILGGGDGLDAYSHAIQDEKTRGAKLENDVRQLGIDIVKALAPDKKAGAFETILKPTPPVQSKWPTA